MKKILLMICIIIVLLCVGLGVFYVWGLGAKETSSEEVTFIIEAGTTKSEVAKNLANAGLIRSEYALDIYFYFSKPTIQAGEYALSASMTPKEMIRKFKTGDIKINTVTITLIEGKTLKEYAETLAEKLDFTANEFVNKTSDVDYLNNLISKYWFLTEKILDAGIYYPLEGYLYPDTYEFLQTATIEDVLETILNHTELKLNTLKSQIDSSERSIHEILTMASIVEKEANTKEDRKMAAQVFYKRLELNMSLGSDVTSYYGVRKNMKEPLTSMDLSNNNPYNTRLTDGTMNGKLPIGPIANSSITSYEAAISPATTNYLYFVANTCTGEVFFQEDYASFITKANELRTICSSN